jgi:hypothetical protein
MITNNENLYAVYSSDGILSGFQENNGNIISTNATAQTIGGGTSNTIYQGDYSTIIGGVSNLISGSAYASILGGSRGVIKRADGAVLLADGQNRIHYGEISNSLALDYANGIYIKNGNDLDNISNESTNTGTFVKIKTGPNFEIGSYIGGRQEQNYIWQTNYYPLARTKMTLMTNNWITGKEYVIRSGQDRRYYTDRIDSISFISLGYDGIYLRGVNTNQTLNGNPSTGYISINGEVVIESAKDGNSITLNSDENINLNGALYARSYFSRGIVDDNIIFNTPFNFYADAGNGINLRSSGANGINLNSVRTSDVITIKSGISLSSSDYNLNLAGERVNISSNDSSINLYAENGMSLKTDSESINIHAGGGDSYSDLDLRANRHITFSGNNFKLNQNLISGKTTQVIFNASGSSGINLISNHPFGAQDSILIKSGVSIESSNYNLYLKGEGASLIANDSTLNLLGEDVNITANNSSMFLNARNLGGEFPNWNDTISLNNGISLSSQTSFSISSSEYGSINTDGNIDINSNNGNLSMYGKLGMTLSSEQPFYINSNQSSISLNSYGDTAIISNYGSLSLASYGYDYENPPGNFGIDLTANGHINLYSYSDDINFYNVPKYNGTRFALEGQFVDLSTNQNIDGIKNFYKTPTVNHIPFLLSGEQEVVYVTGNQIISGLKNFDTLPQVSGKDVVDCFRNQTISGLKTFKTIPQVNGTGVLLFGQGQPSPVQIYNNSVSQGTAASLNFNGGGISVNTVGSIATITATSNTQISTAPLSGTAPGVSGSFVFDENYLYYCKKPNKWTRVPLADW